MKKDLNYYFDNHFKNVDFTKLERYMFHYDFNFSSEGFKKYFFFGFLPKIINNFDSSINYCDECPYYEAFKCHHTQLRDLEHIEQFQNINNKLISRVRIDSPNFDIDDNIRKEFRAYFDVDELNRRCKAMINEYSKNPTLDVFLQPYMKHRSIRKCAELCGLKHSTFNNIYYERSQSKFDYLVLIVIGLNIEPDKVDELFHYMGYHCPNLKYTTKKIALTLFRMALIRLLLSFENRDFDYINVILEINNLNPLKWNAD